MSQAISIEQRPIYDPAIMAPKKRNPPLTKYIQPAPTKACPEGLPNNLDLSALATHLLKNPEVRRDSSKHKLNKMLRAGAKESVASILKVFPGDTRKLEDLSTKQLGAIIIAAESARRHNIAAESFNRDQGSSSVEVWLLNNWVKERIDRSATVMDEMLREEGGSSAGLIVGDGVEYLAGEDAIIGGLASRRVGSGLDLLIRGMIGRGWVSTIYQDIYDNGPHAERAALAVYALASWTNSRWPLDLVHQHSQDLYAAHYSYLVYCPLPEYLNAHFGGHPVVPGKYEPLAIDLLAGDVVATMNLVALRSQLVHAGNGMLTLTESLESDDQAPRALNGNFSLLSSGAVVFGHALETLQSRVETMAIELGRGSTGTLVSLIAQLHEHFCDLFSEYVNDGRSTIVAIMALTDSYDELVRNYDGCPLESRRNAFMCAITQQVTFTPGRRDQVHRLLDAGDFARKQVTKLATEDPLGNQSQIAEIYKALEEMREERDEADRMVGEWAQEVCDIIDQELAAHAEAALEEGESDVSVTPDEDYAALLEEATKSGAALQSENMELKARVENLEGGLAGQRCGQAENGMTQGVREAMQASMSGGNTLTPIQCLLLIKSIYPSTEILPSAWSSAQDAEKFGQTDKLWEALSTLAGKYTEAVVGGTSDSEARKMFTAFQYAANESETTSTSHLRKLREFRYRSESVYFDQHLRFGVAKDVRKTIRVHFKIIDSVLVIAYCGAHRKL